MGRQVFVVDDEVVLAETVTEFFVRRGFDVARFQDAASALSEVGKVRPDFAVADVQMPGLDGVSFARMLRERCPGCEIVLLSGYGELASVSDFEVLPKPFKLLELAQKAERACSRAE